MPDTNPYAQKNEVRFLGITTPTDTSARLWWSVTWKTGLNEVNWFDLLEFNPRRPIQAKGNYYGNYVHKFWTEDLLCRISLCKRH